jgi:uncharacterized protein (DUF58 family)
MTTTVPGDPVPARPGEVPEPPPPAPIAAPTGPPAPTFVPGVPETSAAPGGELARLGIWDAVTPLGRTVAAGGAIAVLLSLVTGWVELAVIGVAALASLGVGVAFLLAGQASLHVLLDLRTPRVVVGNNATTRVGAANPTGRRILPVRLEARVGKGVAHVNVPALGAGAVHDELFVIATTRRSVVPVGPVRSVQGDPLGLVRREVTWTGTEQLYVHPRTVNVASLTTGWMRDLEGAVTNERTMSDIAFHTLREYVHGDDRRHIHWRTTARQPDGQMMVREFVDTRRSQMGLFLSVRAGDYASAAEFELAVSAVASLGLRAIGEEQEVACMAGTRIVPSYHGTSFLDALAAVELGEDDHDVLAMTTRARDLVGSASVVVLASGSRADPSAARRAADRLGPTVRSLAIRAEPDAPSALRITKGRKLLELGALDDLPRLVWAAAT